MFNPYAIRCRPGWNGASGRFRGHLAWLSQLSGQTCRPRHHNEVWSKEHEIRNCELGSRDGRRNRLAVGSSNVYAAEKDIVDTAAAAGQFKTLATALGEAGLVDTPKGPGPFTVFAPTDDAFAKLPAGTVENLLKPENKDELTAIHTYHVVPGRVMAAEVVKLNEAKTLNGKMLNVTVKGSTVMINDAKVTATDVVASNEVIHVIDSVLLPPTK